MQKIDEYIQSPCPIAAELNLLFQPDSPIIIFDIGACEGEDSIRYANMYPHATIYCFEPLPENFARVTTNISRHGKENIFPYCLALSSQNGEARFHVSSGRPENAPDDDWDYGNKSSSLLPPDQTKEIHSWLKFDEVITVTTLRLDDFCHEEGVTGIDFLHLDVQGAELMVLKGAGKRIGAIKAIWIEVEAVSLYQGQPLKQDIEGFMEQHGLVKVVDTVDKTAGDQLYVSTAHFSGKWVEENFRCKGLWQRIKAKFT